MIKQLILHIILKNLEYFSNKFKHAKKTMFYEYIEKFMVVEFAIVKVQDLYCFIKGCVRYIFASFFSMSKIIIFFFS